MILACDGTFDATVFTMVNREDEVTEEEVGLFGDRVIILPPAYIHELLIYNGFLKACRKSFIEFSPFTVCYDGDVMMLVENKKGGEFNSVMYFM